MKEMSDENKTAEQTHARPFEERVLAAIADMRADFNARLERLEAKTYDTKPIWERALAEISETRQDLAAFRRAVELEMRVIHEDSRRVRVEQEDLKDHVAALENRPA